MIYEIEDGKREARFPQFRMNSRPMRLRSERPSHEQQARRRTDRRHTWADKAHLPGYAAHERVNLDRLYADLDGGRAKAMAEKYGAQKVYTDPERLIADFGRAGDGAKSQEIVDAIIQAHFERRWIDLPDKAQ